MFFGVWVGHSTDKIRMFDSNEIKTIQNLPLSEYNGFSRALLLLGIAPPSLALLLNEPVSLLVAHCYFFLLIEDSCGQSCAPHHGYSLTGASLAPGTREGVLHPSHLLPWKDILPFHR